MTAAEGAEVGLVNELLAQNEIKITGRRIYLVTDGSHSKHTNRNYRYAFNNFLKYGAKTQDLEVLLDYSSNIIEEMIISYIEMLRDVKGYTHQTINLHCNAIFYFFSLNRKLIDQRRITRFIPPDESTQSERAYTPDEIARILESSSDTRTRVIVLLMASTGMRIGAIPVLKVGHLTKIPEYNLYKIEVYANSRKGRYFTYCTQECRSVIDSYLDYRRRLGEKITDKSPLIREMFDSQNPFIINAPKQATEKMIYGALEQALKNAGVNQRLIGLGKGKRRDIMRSHGFRKFCITTMRKAKVDFTDREYLVGHKASLGLDLNYDRTSEEDRLVEYLKAIDLLTISEEHRLKKQIEAAELGHSAEWNQLKQQMNELRDLLNLKQS